MKDIQTEEKDTPTEIKDIRMVKTTQLDITAPATDLIFYTATPINNKLITISKLYQWAFLPFLRRELDTVIPLDIYTIKVPESPPKA